LKSFSACSFRHFLFQERQAVTFISALQLALTACLAVFIFILGRLLYEKSKDRLRDVSVWAISAGIFIFCMIDEYFMLHEGIDGDIATAFFGITENPHLDGLTLSLYLVGALVVFLKFKKEILRHKEAFQIFCMGALFFLCSILLDLKSEAAFKIVLEESMKLFAVSCMFMGHASVLGDYINEMRQKLRNGA